MSKLFRVKVYQTSNETFTVRAESQEEAKQEAENLADGKNLTLDDSKVIQEMEDDGREVDNE